MSRTVLLVILVLAARETAWAQLDSRVKVGARVRVNRVDAQIIGRVAAIRNDTIVVNRGPRDSLVSLSLEDATGLDVYTYGRGAQGLVRAFGIIGAAAGAGLYVNWCTNNPDACSRLEYEERRRSCDEEEDEESSSTFATVTAGFGLLGMLFGYALAPREWRAVNLPVRVGVGPVHNGVLAYVSVPAPRFLRAFR